VTRTSRRDRCPSTKGLFLLAALLATPGGAVADQEAGNRPYVAASAHGQFYAKSVPSETYGTAGTTRVYQVRNGGDALIQTYAWYSPRIFLEGWTGTGTVYVVRTGPWARGRRAKEEHLALALYRNEKLLKSYSTLDVAGSPERVAASVSHYVVFSELKGFRRPFGNQLYFDAVTHDGRKLSFDAETGEITSEDEVRVKGQLYEAQVKIGQLKHQWFTRNSARYEKDKGLLLTEQMLSEGALGEFPELPAGYRYKPGPVWGPAEFEKIK
jgi:hypothetical protein